MARIFPLVGILSFRSHSNPTFNSRPHTKPQKYTQPPGHRTVLSSIWFPPLFIFFLYVHPTPVPRTVCFTLFVVLVISPPPSTPHGKDLKCHIHCPPHQNDSKNDHLPYRCFAWVCVEPVLLQSSPFRLFRPLRSFHRLESCIFIIGVWFLFTRKYTGSPQSFPWFISAFRCSFIIVCLASATNHLPHCSSFFSAKHDNLFLQEICPHHLFFPGLTMQNSLPLGLPRPQRANLRPIPQEKVARMLISCLQFSDCGLWVVLAMFGLPFVLLGSICFRLLSQRAPRTVFTPILNTPFQGW